MVLFEDYRLSRNMLSFKIEIMLERIQIIFVFVFATVSIAFCSTTSDVNKAYVKQFRNIAVEEMHRTGIPASIKLAQAILEF